MDQQGDNPSDGGNENGAGNGSDENGQIGNLLLAMQRRQQQQNHQQQQQQTQQQQQSNPFQQQSTQYSQSSLSQSFDDQQPGPSGLNIFHQVGRTPLPGSSSGSSSLDASVPEVRTPGAEARPPPPSSSVHPYELSSSQDVFPIGASQDPLFSTSYEADLRQAQEQTQEEQTQEEQTRQLFAYYEEQDRERERRQEQHNNESDEEGTETEQSQDEDMAPHVRAAAERATAHVQRLRLQYLSKKCRVPAAGGTESSQSSDDSTTREMKARVKRQLSDCAGVPDQPCSSLATHSQRSGDQEMIHSDGSSSEPQVTPGEQKRQKVSFGRVVPRLSTSKELKLRAIERERERERVRRSQEGANLPAIAEQSNASEVTSEGGGEGGTPSEGEDSSRSQSQGRQGVSEEERNGHPEPESVSQSSPHNQHVSTPGSSVSGTQESQPPSQLRNDQSSTPGSSVSGTQESQPPSQLRNVQTHPDSQSGESLSEIEEACQRVRRPVAKRRRAHGNVPPASLPDDTHELLSMSGRREMTAGTPDWGATTDASTEYPLTTTTSSWPSSGSSSDSTSVTMASSGERGRSVGLDSDAQPSSQTLPISSTPQDDEMIMPPPHFPGPTPSKKQSSDGTTTSTSTTTSSGSGGLLEKTRCTRQPLPLSMESLELSPLALESQPLDDDNDRREDLGGAPVVIPSTPPSSEQMMEASPTHEPAGPVSTSQELFEEGTLDSQDLIDQEPRWYKNQFSTSLDEEDQSQREGSSSKPVKRPLPKESPSGSSSDQSCTSPVAPPPKRRRTTPLGSSSLDLPRWQKGDTPPGPSGQAQPSSQPSLSRKSSNLNGSGSKSSGSGKDSDKSSGSSPYISSSSSSGNQTSSCDISSSSGQGSGSGSLGRSISSEELSGGSRHSSGGSGGGKLSGDSQPGNSGNSSGSAKDESKLSGDSQPGSSGNSSGGAKDESKLSGDSQPGSSGDSKEDVDERESKSVEERKSATVSTSFAGSLRCSESIGLSESGSLLKPGNMYPSPGNEGGESSSGSSSGSIQGTDADKSPSKSVPESVEHSSIHVVEDSVQNTSVEMPMESESERQQATWQLQRSASSCSTSNSKPGDSHIGLSIEQTTIDTDRNMEEETIECESEVEPQAPGSPELLQEPDEEDSPEIVLQAPVFTTSHQLSSTPGGRLSKSQDGQRVEPMEVESSRDLSTQSSFALHLSQSQPPTSNVSTYREAQGLSQMETSTLSIAAIGTSYGSVEEIEEHEKEFPNLRETTQSCEQTIEQSVSNETVSSSQNQKQSLETSGSSSSSSQSGGKSDSSSGSKSDREGGDGGEGGGAGGKGGGAGEGGGGGGRSGNGGVGGSASHKDDHSDSERMQEHHDGEGSAGDMIGDGGKESDNVIVSAKAIGTITAAQKRPVIGSDRPTITVVQKGPVIGSDRPTITVVQKRPVIGSDRPTITVVQKRPVPVYESIRYDSESQQSQCESSASIPLSSAVAQVHVQAVAASSQARESQLSMEISQQLTPSGTVFNFQLPHGGLLRPNLCITPPSQKRSNGTLSPDSSTPSHNVVHPSRNSQNSAGVSILSPSELNQSLFRPITQPQASAESQKGQRGSKRQPALFQVTEKAAPNDKASSQSSSGNMEGSSSNDKASQSERASQKQSTCKDTAGIPSQPTAVTCVENTDPVECTVTAPKNAARSPSGKSLSLRRVRSSPAATKTAHRRNIQNGAILSVERGKNDISRLGSGETANGFVLGMNSQDQEPHSEEGSQFVLPAISIPSDSQFGSSENSQFLLNSFRIERPQCGPVPPASSSRRPLSPPTGSIFSNVKASKRTPRKTFEVARAHDPYEFHSQSEDVDVGFAMRTKQCGKNLDGIVGDVEMVDVCPAGDAPEGNGGDQNGHGDGNGGHPSQENGEHSQSTSQQSQKTESQSQASSSYGEVSRNVANNTSQQQHASTITSALSEGPLVQPTLPPSSSSHTPTITTASPVIVTSTSTTGISSAPTTPLACTPPLQFTSPSGVFSRSQLHEFSQQYGKEGGRWVLQHVKTFRTVTYHHVISSEVMKGNKVLEEEANVWQETGQPQCSEDSVSFRILPLPPPTPEASSQDSQQSSGAVSILPPPGLLTRRASGSGTMIKSPISFSVMQLPSAAITSSISTLTTKTLPSGIQSHPSTGGIISPQFRQHHHPLSPVRLVSPGHVSTRSTRSTTSLEENPLPPPPAKRPSSTSTQRERGDVQKLTKPSDRSGKQTLEGSVKSSVLQGRAQTARQPLERNSRHGSNKIRQQASSVQQEEQTTRQPPLDSTAQTAKPPVVSPVEQPAKRTRQGKQPHAVSAPSINTRSKGRQTRTGSSTKVTPSPSITPVPPRVTPVTPRGESPATKSSSITPSSNSKRGGGRGKKGRGRKRKQEDDGDVRSGEVVAETAAAKPFLDQPGPSGPPAPVVIVGSSVLARWRDGCWYPGSVTGEAKHGRLHIRFVDDDKYVLSASNVLLLEQVKKDVSVTAMEDDEQGLPEINGLFAGFSDASMDHFTINMGMGRQEVCGTYRMVLPAESALRCKEESPAGSDRKRRRSLEELSLTTPAAVKKRKTSSPKGGPTSAEEPRAVPPRQRRLLDGFMFLLTQRTKDDGSSASPPPQPVDRELIHSQIVNRGGRVLDHYSGEKVIDRRFFVVSDAYCRTCKYLIGLGLGVPLVSYDWIKDCITQGSIVDHQDYLLPAGLSHETKKVIKWEPRPLSTILDGMHVYLIGSDSFKTSWTRVLKAAGAEAVPKLPSTHQLVKDEPDEGSPVCDTVVCESPESKQVPKSILFRSSTMGLKLLSTQWIVQSLIHAKKLENYDDYWYNKF